MYDLSARHADAGNFPTGVHFPAVLSVFKQYHDNTCLLGCSNKQTTRCFMSEMMLTCFLTVLRSVFIISNRKISN